MDAKPLTPSSSRCRPTLRYQQEAITAVMAESPLIPSIKLKAFTMATTQSPARINAINCNSSWRNAKPVTNPAATRDWAARRGSAERLQMSSTNPSAKYIITMTITNRGAANPVACSATPPTSIAKAKPTPAPRGTTEECELRWLGTSSVPIRLSIAMTRGITRTHAINDVTRPTAVGGKVTLNRRGRRGRRGSSSHRCRAQQRFASREVQLFGQRLMGPFSRRPPAVTR